MWTKNGLNSYLCPMPTIKFYIQSDKKPAGIYVRLREGRNIDAKAKTNYAINPVDWNNKKQKPTNLNDEAFKKLEEKLIDFKSNLLKHYNNSVDSCQIDSLWLKNFINPPKEEDSIPNKLVEYFDYYLLHRKSVIAKSSYTKYVVVKHLLERFQKEMKTEYFIKDVTADFKLKFENYCLHSVNYSRNTFARAFRFIKTICYDARNNGVETHHQLNRLTTKNEKVEKIFLTFEELDQIQKKELTAEHLDNARDWLLISCEVGQRVSDFLQFTKEMIRYEVAKSGVKVPLIDFTQVKTQKIMTVVLNKKVIAILEKRGGEFPRKLSSQNYNQHIKEVCEIVGLTQKIKGSKINLETNRKESGLFPKFELVTSHIGRRSFATNYYGKIPTSLLMNATGHTTEQMFLEYIGKTETEKAKQLAEYFA